MAIDDITQAQNPVRRIINYPGQLLQTAPSGGSSVSGGLTHRAYTGTTNGGGTVGTISLTGTAYSLIFFNKSSSTAVEVSTDGTNFLPMNANDSWHLKPPSGFANGAPWTEIYHRKTTSGTSNWAVSTWEA